MLQGILEQSTQKYPIGMRYAEGDRVFRYCKTGGDLVAMKAAHNDTGPTECNTAAVEYAAGTYQVTILDIVAHPADYYKDGYIWIMDLVSGIYRMHKIKSSTAGDSVSITLTLYEALTLVVGASTWITAWPNIYSNVVATASSFMSNVCVPLIPVTSGKYFWGQTWGPCFGTVMGTVPGREANQREVYFHTDGALLTGVETSLDSVLHQRAGYLITNTEPGGAGYGDQFYMLQLAP